MEALQEERQLITHYLFNQLAEPPPIEEEKKKSNSIQLLK